MVLDAHGDGVHEDGQEDEALEVRVVDDGFDGRRDLQPLSVAEDARTR